MLARRVVPAVAVLAGLACAVAPATAAPKPKPKPITKSYEMQLLPLPLPAQGTTCLPADGVEGTTKHTEELTVSGPGLLVGEVWNFISDWDITVFNDKGAILGAGAGTTTPSTANPGKDVVKVKIKKAGKLTVTTCNFLGGPTASGKYTFTYS